MGVSYTDAGETGVSFMVIAMDVPMVAFNFFMQLFPVKTFQVCSKTFSFMPPFLL